MGESLGWERVSRDHIPFYDSLSALANKRDIMGISNPAVSAFII